MFKWLERADSENDHLQATLSLTANDSILGCSINVFVTYQHLAHVNESKGRAKARAALVGSSVRTHDRPCNSIRGLDWGPPQKDTASWEGSPAGSEGVMEE